MRLIIVTGQEGTDVENLLRRIISENKYIYMTMLLKWYFLKDPVYFTIQEAFTATSEELLAIISTVMKICLWQHFLTMQCME